VGKGELESRGHGNSNDDDGVLLLTGVNDETLAM
jgi:hypothetical protein